MVRWDGACSWRGQCPTINQMNVGEKSNMKYSARVFLPVSAKGTSEVTQTAQFILRGLRECSYKDAHSPKLEGHEFGCLVEPGPKEMGNETIPQCLYMFTDTTWFGMKDCSLTTVEWGGDTIVYSCTQYGRPWFIIRSIQPCEKANGKP